jgi:uncharacterized paraquat-inducible protein A
MGRHHAPDDYEDDPNEPDESDTDADDSADVDTVTCPNCRRDVYEGAEQCPRCGHYFSAEDAPQRSHPTWVIVTAALLLAMTAFALFRFGL